MSFIFLPFSYLLLEIWLKVQVFFRNLKLNLFFVVSKEQFKELNCWRRPFIFNTSCSSKFVSPIKELNSGISQIWLAEHALCFLRSYFSFLHLSLISFAFTTCRPYFLTDTDALISRTRSLFEEMLIPTSILSLPPFVEYVAHGRLSSMDN